MRALKGLVFVMTLAILVLMTLLVYGLYQKSQDPDFKFFKVSETAPQAAPEAPDGPAPGAVASRAFGDVTLPLPPGARIQSATVSGERLVVIVAMPEGDQVWVVDLSTGQVLGRIKGHPGGEGGR